MDAGEIELGDGDQFQGTVQCQCLLAAHWGVPKEIRDLCACSVRHILLFWIQGAWPPAQQSKASAEWAIEHSWGWAPWAGGLHFPDEAGLASSFAGGVQEDRGGRGVVEAIDSVPDNKDRVQCEQRGAVLWADVQRGLHGGVGHFGMCFHSYS